MITNETDLRAALLDGGEIYVDSSNLIALSGKLEVTKPTKLVGGMFSIDSGPAFEITSSNVELDRVQILGGMANGGSDRAQKLIWGRGTQAAPLENVVINQCRLFASRGDNVWLEWVNDSLVTYNITKRYLYSGIMLISCDGVVVNGNNVFDARLQDPVVNVYGIAVTDLDNTEQARSRNITITGNRCHLIDWEAIDTHGADGVTITGNVVTASPRGIALVTGNATRIAGPENNVVTGNYVNGRGARQTLRAGIFLGGTVDHPADAVIVGNGISNYGTPLFTNHVDWSKTVIDNNRA